MANLLPFPPLPAPPPAVVRILAQYDRPKLEAFITIAIDLLDTFDGDPDVEHNGDEMDATGGEDDCYDGGGRPYPWGGPGCLVSDPGGGDVGDEGEPEHHQAPDYGVDQTPRSDWPPA